MPLSKCCTKCGERKPVAQFPFRKERGVHEAACKVCASMRTQNWVERCASEVAAPLQAEIERWKSLAANQEDLTYIAVKIAKELRDERDQLKARSDELEGLLRSALEDSLDIEVLRMMRGSVYVSRLSDRIKAALAKPAGSEKV